MWLSGLVKIDENGILDTCMDWSISYYMNTWWFLMFDDDNMFIMMIWYELDN